MNNAKKINEAELEVILRNGKLINGGTFVGIDTVTIPKLKGGKSNPQQGDVTKTNTGSSVMVFQNKNSNAYENMVGRRLIAEGKDPETFELGARVWGTREEGTPLVKHTPKGETKAQLYMEVIFLKSGKNTFQLNGKEIDKNDVIGLDLKKEEGNQGGLSNKVIIRTYKLSSIARITIGKQTYIIED